MKLRIDSDNLKAMFTKQNQDMKRFMSQFRESSRVHKRSKLEVKSRYNKVSEHSYGLFYI